MLCVNKLTNLVFNAKKINAKHNLLPFYFLFFLFEKNKKQPRMKCNANPRNKKQKPKNNGHKEYSNEAQGSC